jgi:ferredoxin-NADP reductase
MEKQRFTSKLLDKKNLTHNIIELILEKPQEFSFEAGQFIQIYIPHQEKEIKRSYSICSTPEEDVIRLCVKLVEKGIGSSHLTNLSVGDTLEFSGPHGAFGIKKTNNPAIFIATGAGIAPILPTLQKQLNENPEEKTVVIFGVRHEEDVFYHDVFKSLKHKHPNLEYIITLSQPKEESAYESGRVTDHLQNHIDTKAHYYFCGSPAMIMDVRKKLTEENIPNKQMHFEMF